MQCRLKQKFFLHCIFYLHEFKGGNKMNAQIDISTVTLKTDRLFLRPWKETDLQDFYNYAHVDGIGQMAGWMPHKNKEESKRILNLFIEEKKTFALEYQGKVIGSLGIEEYSEEHYPELSNLSGREIGYVLSKDYWGQGLMPEAVKAVIKYLFQTIKLDFILVGHFEWNRQSARVIEKCGFQYIKSRPFKTQYRTIENSDESILYRSHFMNGFFFENDTELVQEIYRRYDENSRLTTSKAARVECKRTIT